MKKVLSITLALMMLFTSVSAAFTAEAKAASKTQQVQIRIQKAAEYIIANTYDMSTLSYPDYWTLLKSGVDMTAYRDNCLNSLKENLAANDGRIVISGTEWYQDENGDWQSYSYSYEDIAVYGAAILITGYYGYDPADFEGYDLTEPFESFDLSTVTQPYSFRTAIEAVQSKYWYGDGEYADELAICLISNFYDMGKGMNYYGYSCDNTGHFVAAISGFDGAYDAYIDDALAVIKTFTKDNGAYADAVYVTDVNADSTALAMMGYAAAKNYDGAYWYYDKLISNFYNAETGAFQTASYTTGELEDNMYATKDALLGLEYYYENITDCHAWDEGTVVKAATCTQAGTIRYECKACGKTKIALITPAHTPAAAVKENEVKATTSKAGSYDSVVYCSVCKTELSRETVSVPKLAKKANTLTVKAKKPTVKYSKLKKKNQTIAAKNAVTVSKAQGKVTYKKSSGNKKITVASNGKITVKKGLKKGTYKVKIKVTAAGNATYKSGSKTVTVTIKVK